MAVFIISLDAVHGDQLADEIQSATGINVRERYNLIHPDKLEITGPDIDAAHAQILAVVNAHVPNWLYFPADQERAVSEAASDQAAAVPGWASWTEAQALDWFDTNIDPLAIPEPLKVFLRAQARMTIALRNKAFPWLEGK